MENIRILLVEGDRVDQMAFERLVKDENLSYDYDIAGSVSEARRILDSESSILQSWIVPLEIARHSIFSA